MWIVPEWGMIVVCLSTNGDWTFDDKLNPFFKLLGRPSQTGSLDAADFPESVEGLESCKRERCLNQL